MMDDMVIMGVGYTPQYSLGTSTHFNYKEMNDSFAKSVIKLPVFIEHDDSTPIGHVHDAFINELRQLVVILHIHGAGPINRRLQAAITKDRMLGEAFFNDLSLATDVAFSISDEGFFNVVQNVPVEMSIVKKGARPNCHIERFWVIPSYVNNVDEYIHDLVAPHICRF